jgi:hypothetical protein
LPNLPNLARLGSVLADRGATAEAEVAFASAQAHFRDVNPLPLAWMYLQAGMMWQRQGSLSRARSLFEEAHRRLPDYAAATSHLAATLAATGEPARARELLCALAEQADDPEYAAQCAGLLDDAGRADDAAPLRARAAARYDQLIARHPEAFAEGAARFWLTVGGSPKRALALAEKNVAVRPIADAYALVIEAALAANATARACQAAQAAERLGATTARLTLLAGRARAACSL